MDLRKEFEKETGKKKPESASAHTASLGFLRLLEWTSDYIKWLEQKLTHSQQSLPSDEEIKEKIIAVKKDITDPDMRWGLREGFLICIEWLKQRQSKKEG